MANSLQRFRIVGLHGNRTIDLRIKDDTLILVGENGTGKTTILRLLFYFLSGRWNQLSQFKFQSISATIAGSKHEIRHSDLQPDASTLDSELFSDLPVAAAKRIRTMARRGMTEAAFEELERIEMRFGIPARHYANQLDLFAAEKPRRAKKRIEQIESVRAAMDAQVLYLPTFRRIERELDSILEGFDPDEMRNRRRRLRHSATSTLLKNSSPGVTE